jgi:hypothetical protein
MSGPMADVFRRLNTLLDAETRDLEAGLPLALAANADAKARILLELAMAAPGRTELPGTDQSMADRLVIDETRESLARNAAALERHMTATRHVAQALARVLRAEDSDGTYGPGATHGRRAG